MKDFALLILRLVFGGLMAGHGSQKLFGWFEGPGPEGTSKMVESMGLKPGKVWGLMAGASEFGGGALTLLGALNPIGSLGTIGSMEMATAKAHWGKPIWVTKGGAELPVLNIAAALALGIAGPGKYSLDNALGIHLPRRLVLVPGLALTGAAVAFGVISSNRPQPQPAEQKQADTKPQARAEERPAAVRVPDMPEKGESAQQDERAAHEPGMEEGTNLEAEQSADLPA